MLFVSMQVSSQTIQQLSSSGADSIRLLLDKAGSGDQYFRNQMNIWHSGILEYGNQSLLCVTFN